MAANFLHGVEFIEVQSGSRYIQLAKASVIGLVGVAPMEPLNTPVLVTNALWQRSSEVMLMSYRV